MLQSIFGQRYVKNVFPSLYLGFNESLKGVKMKYKSISFIVHGLEPKKNGYLAMGGRKLQTTINF